MGVEGAMPSVQEIQEIRQEVGRRVAELEAEEVDVGDVARINNDDKYVAKFFRHVFDHPGEQTEAAAKMIVSTLKWRKKQGASNIKEADFPASVFEKGALFSHNRWLFYLHYFSTQYLLQG